MGITTTKKKRASKALTKIKKDNCPDCPFKSRTVGTRGNSKSKIVIIGESPGPTEVRMGTPFIGPSGKFLDELLETVGITEEPYYTNAFKCLPPRSNRDKKDKLLNEACKACNSRLIEEISSAPRKLIVAMGNAALRSLTGNYNMYITRERGILRSHNLASVGLIPCLHPAHVLRNEGLYPQMLSDMEKVANLLREEIPTDPKYTYKIVSSLAELKVLAVKVKRAGTVIADIETTGLDQFKDEFTCIGIVPTPLPAHTSKQRITVYVIEELKKFRVLLTLIPSSTKWVWHNGKFDVGFLWAKGLTEKEIHVDHDTMLLSYALDENTGRHGLERCIMDWLGVVGYKGMIGDYLLVGSKIKTKGKALKKKAGVKAKKTLYEYEMEALYELTKESPGITKEMRSQYVRTGMAKKAYALIPKDVLYDYLAKDVVYTGWLYQKLLPLVEGNEHLGQLYNKMLIPASNALAKVELNGLPIDQTVAAKSEKELLEEVEPIIHNLRRICGDPTYNPRSQPQTMAVLTTGDKERGSVGRGFKLRKSDAETLEQYKDDEFVGALLEYRKRQKLLGTYIRPYRVGNAKSLAGLEEGRIHTSFLIHGTVTGRLSSSGPNVQNIPKVKIIRRFFKPCSKRIFVSLDYSQAELRSLAVLSGDKNLISIFRSGQDLHTAVATKVFGEEFTSLDKTDDEQAFTWGKIRRKAKTINFGVVYGVSAPTLAERLSISIDEAQELIDGWFKEFPVAKEFMKQTRDVRNQTLITVFGRKRRFHIMTEQNQHGLANEAGNFLHQSMCSDFTLESCIRLNWTENVVASLPGNPRQVNIIHDDNMFEVDRDKEAVIRLILATQKVMEQVPIDMGITEVPFTADASIGDDWASLKDVRMDTLEHNKLMYKIGD